LPFGAAAKTEDTSFAFFSAALESFFGATLLAPRLHAAAAPPPPQQQRLRAAPQATATATIACNNLELAQHQPCWL
jgi:hypothetical protein